LRLALSEGPNRVGVSLHLRTQTDPVSESSCFSSNYLESGRWTKSENPVILCVWRMHGAVFFRKSPRIIPSTRRHESNTKQQKDLSSLCLKVRIHYGKQMFHNCDMTSQPVLPHCRCFRQLEQRSLIYKREMDREVAIATPRVGLWTSTTAVSKYKLWNCRLQLTH
jgi:hypothetical protein